MCELAGASRVVGGCGRVSSATWPSLCLSHACDRCHPGVLSSDGRVLATVAPAGFEIPAGKGKVRVLGPQI
jgi:hypothetical protein